MWNKKIERARSLVVLCTAKKKSTCLDRHAVWCDVVVVVVVVEKPKYSFHFFVYL